MKDIKDFQERYNRWKNGERYWDIRGIDLPKYDTGKKNTNNQEYIFQRPDGTYYSSSTNDGAFTEDVTPVLKRDLSNAATWDFVGSDTNKKYTTQYTDDQLKQMAQDQFQNSEMIPWVDRAGNKHRDINVKGAVPVTVPGEVADFAFQTLFNPYQKYRLPNDGDGLINFLSVAPSVKGIPSVAYNFIDKIPTFGKELMTYKSNTLNRLIGLGNSGYSDLLKSGIVRGNMHPNGIFTTKQLHKYMIALDGKLSENDLRALSSQFFENEQQFNRINNALKQLYKPVSGQSKLLQKNVSLGTWNDYINRMRNTNYMQFYNVFSQNASKNKWLKNWMNYAQREVDPKTTSILDVEWPNLPTFATEKQEVLDLLKQNVRRGSYVGDYGLQIKNADKYAVPFTDGGHFAIHPTSRYPIELNNPDLSVYAMKRGILSGEPYMVKLSKRQLQSDLKRIKAGLNPKNHVNKWSLYLGPIQNQNVPFIPTSQMINSLRNEKEK